MTIENGDTAHSTNIAPFKNERVNDYPTFLPRQQQPIGSLLPASKYPQNSIPSKLFEPLTIRGQTYPNRLWVAPMCMYSSDNGAATDHHFVHLGSMAMRGWGNIMVEASGVVPEGRIAPEDSGIWSDDHIAPFKRIVDYVHGLGGKIGIQIAHAGRKGSTLATWVEVNARSEGWKGGSVVPEENGGWPNGTYAPSALNFNPGKYPEPVEASLEYIDYLKQAWRSAVERCKTIDFDFIEIHGAHGYLLHEFASPLTNKRTDRYGGNFENRIRLHLENTKLVRDIWEKPLYFRVSASDWLENVEGPERAHAGQVEEWGWWGIEQTTLLAARLRDLGIDLLDVSSGGNDLRQQITVGPRYQLHFAKHIKENVPNLLVGAVGIITEAHEANDILERGEADVIFMARNVLRNIDFPLQAAQELGVAANAAVQYRPAWSRMIAPRNSPKISKRRLSLLHAEKEEGIHESIP